MEIALEELSIEVSNKCALMCIHCSSGSKDRDYEGELTRDEHFKLIREARELGATVLSLSGGDPILVEDIQDYVALAKDVGYERVLFYTTGVWQVDYSSIATPGGELTGTMWGIESWPHLTELMKAGWVGNSVAGRSILTFIFSLHSHVPTVNDYIMGITGCWHTITASILALREYSHTDVEVHMVPMLPNYTHIPQMRSLCAMLGVSKMSLLRFVPQTRGLSNKARLDPGIEEFELIQKMIAAETRMRSKHSVELRVGCPIDFRHTIGATGEKPNPCHAGMDLILVRPDGAIHPCAAWKTLPSEDNARDRPLTEIWENSVVFNALRDYHQGKYKERVGICKVCKYNDSCMGGCPAQRMHAYGKNIGDLYDSKPDPLCRIGNVHQVSDRRAKSPGRVLSRKDRRTMRKRMKKIVAQQVKKAPPVAVTEEEE